MNLSWIDCACWASFCASATICANVWVDRIDIAFADSFYWTFADASAMIVNWVSLVQVLISYWHVKKGSPVTTVENIIFLLLYVGMGFIGFHRALDFLPIIASVFNMLAVFQKDEQKTRYLVLCNASIFCAYYIILGSTSLLAELMAVITTVIALIKYRKKA